LGEPATRDGEDDRCFLANNAVPGGGWARCDTHVRSEGGTAIPFAGEVSIEPETKTSIDAAIEVYGRLDVLVNNAGVLLVGAETDKTPVDKFDDHIRCDIRTAFLMTKYALPHLRETRGNIMSAGSAAGINGEPGATACGGMKGFLHAFMAGVAVEQAKYGDGANRVCPGPTDTAWTHKETAAVNATIEAQGGAVRAARDI
jgi:NAD(P)-dependent dehydrogenase (short-subunit alcohol dehydrogenase family)